jgi:hypothetical protein
MQKCFLITCLLLSAKCVAQEEKDSNLSLSGYLDIYYVYDFNKPEDGNRPAFVYSFDRSGEFNLNLGFIKGAYETPRMRANIALMTGTYANANLANEPGVLKHILEANAGVKLSANHDIWIDAGILPSHIGFESATSKDCWNLTRSILADNSPYYEAGARVSCASNNDKWFVSGLILNGWQRIQKVRNNSLLSFGTQLTFKPSPSVTLNYSTFIGTDKPDTARLMRYFNNFYNVVQLSDKVGLTLGFDYGLEQKDVNERGFNAWYSPIGIFRLKLNDKWITAVRGEYYADEAGVIIQNANLTGVRLTGISMNMDYQITSSATWRIEVRSLSSGRKAFIRNGKEVNDNMFITTCLAVNF